MIQKYTFGTPFNTEAVVNEFQTSEGELPFFTVEENGDFKYEMDDDTVVYGLGEQIRGINKRGWQYVSWNYDNPHHHEDTRSLYGSHNFLVIRGKDLFGVFFDYPGKLTFDIGYTNRSLMSIHPDKCDMDIYIITGLSETDIVSQFRQIIGRSYVAPLWAFGYGQSRWGYMNESDIREVASKYDEANVPLDSIYMDIDYMERYKDFTVSDERFPNLSKLAGDMRKEGIHLVPIIDAGVKIEDGYDVYEEGVKRNLFCKNEDGKDFVAAVWPGKVCFPDFLNPEAREWFGALYERLTSCGIDGFWNDMNEPAIFYTEELLQETLSKISELNNGNMGISEFFALTGMVGGLNGNETYYDKFYHNVNGRSVKHSEVHNLYGMNMTRSANEALNKIEPNKRTLFFSRSSYIGAHRYGGIWQGDNKSWWSHILQGMQQLPALNMSGFMFIGSDMGGFGCDTTEDLMLRWLQYSMFTPLYRNHSCDGTRDQELYRFSSLPALKNMIEIRYSLIPYIYSEYLKSVLNNKMMFRPLSFDFTDDEIAVDIDDQLFVGDEIMITPIYHQNARGRYVYLPEAMKLCRMRSYGDYELLDYEKGHHFISCELEEFIFFIRENKSLPLGKPSKCTRDIDFSTLKLIGYDVSYELYKDDGISSDLSKTLKIVKM